MKTFVQTLVLVAGIAGLSACASSDADTYEGRTAGSSMSSELAACNERVRRLEEMNKACYRK
jgi:hypothetical protein